jgi:hypothetical protein
MKMKSMWRWSVLSCFVAALAAAGCTESKPATTTKNGTASGGGSASKAPAKFKLAWSEYPSWSIFGVADEVGLIDGKEGAMGSIEKKYNVDIELVLADYDQCITSTESPRPMRFASPTSISWEALVLDPQ